MMTINKGDIVKTAVIVWFIAATGYVVYDQVATYKLKGLQQAYQTGYGTAVDDFMKKVKEGNCQPFEINKNNEKVSVVSASCLNQTMPTFDDVQPAKK